MHSPLLFSIIIADLEEEMRKGQVGGVQIGKERIWSLAYADDLVLLAKSEEGMKEMVKRMKNYLKKKRLQLNTEKSKMMCFRKGGGRRRKIEWKWRGERIEEISEFKYLGYVFRRNGENEGHIKKLKRKGNIVMRQVWSLYERKFWEDFKKRLMLFKYLVLGVILYGAEIWGWREKKELEKIQKKFIKWTLGLDPCTLDYIVYKETDIDRIRTIAGCRVVKFEEKAMREGNRKLLVECIKEREKEGNVRGMKEEREKFYRQNGFSLEGIKRLRERNTQVEAVVKRNERERLGQWIEGKIKNSTYNSRYKERMMVGTPKYQEQPYITSRFRPAISL